MSEPSPAKLQFWRTPNGFALALVVILSFWAWWMIAWPVFSFDRVAQHAGHHPTVFLHTIGGTGMLVFGAFNFYLAGSRKNWRWHRFSGRAYLVLGIVGSVTAVTVLLAPNHKEPSDPILTNITVSLLTLAVGWLVFAAMGLRAAVNRRFDSHRDWMVRAYILVWSFVACRIVSRTTVLDEGQGVEWLIWLTWVGPLILGEIILQWRNGSRQTGKSKPVQGN